MFPKLSGKKGLGVHYSTTLLWFANLLQNILPAYHLPFQTVSHSKFWIFQVSIGGLVYMWNEKWRTEDTPGFASKPLTQAQGL
jgi:hypothetical protein